MGRCIQMNRTILVIAYMALSVAFIALAAPQDRPMMPTTGPGMGAGSGDMTIEATVVNLTDWLKMGVGSGAAMPGGGTVAPGGAGAVGAATAPAPSPSTVEPGMPIGLVVTSVTMTGGGAGSIDVQKNAGRSDANNVGGAGMGSADGSSTGDIGGTGMGAGKAAGMVKVGDVLIAVADKDNSVSRAAYSQLRTMVGQKVSVSGKMLSRGGVHALVVTSVGKATAGPGAGSIDMNKGSGAPRQQYPSGKPQNDNVPSK